MTASFPNPLAIKSYLLEGASVDFLRIVSGFLRQGITRRCFEPDVSRPGPFPVAIGDIQGRADGLNPGGQLGYIGAAIN